MKIQRHIGNAPGARFMGAEIFAGMAILALGFALLGPSHPSVLYTPTATIIFDPSPSRLQLFTAVLSTISALAYFAVARWSSHSANNSLMIVHFVLFATGLSLITATVMGLANLAIPRGNLCDPNAGCEGVRAWLLLPWPMQAVVIGTLSVRLGCLIFVVNLGLMAIKSFRTRRKFV